MWEHSLNDNAGDFRGQQLIQAVIFDFDGLILDTEAPDYLSWKETYAAFGIELPLDVWNRNIGAVDLFNPYLYLEAQLGRPIDREAVHAQRRARDDMSLAQLIDALLRATAASRYNNRLASMFKVRAAAIGRKPEFNSYMQGTLASGTNRTASAV